MRNDGRSPDELRPVTIEPDLVQADHAVRFDVIHDDGLHGIAAIVGNPVRKSTGTRAACQSWQ